MACILPPPGYIRGDKRATDSEPNIENFTIAASAEAEYLVSGAFRRPKTKNSFNFLFLLVKKFPLTRGVVRLKTEN